MAKQIQRKVISSQSLQIAARVVVVDPGLVVVHFSRHALERGAVAGR
jgi:hypothetical protein